MKGEELTAEMQTLEAKLEAEVANKQDLETQRDLTWTTYTMLAQTEAEVMVATQSGGTEVRVASMSTPPTKPVGQGRFSSVAIAGALGLTLGVLGVFALEWWQGDAQRETERQRGKETKRKLAGE